MKSWLHPFAVLTAGATFLLVGIGGLVTSHGVGMAVPDWPNTYGYNMFFFPFSRWVGGIFYEHSHRLFASGVGLLTTILALWLYGKNARPLLRWGGLGLVLLGLGGGVGAPGHREDSLVLAVTGLVALAASLVWPRNDPAPKWLRRLGLIGFFMVVLQGVLGGLRVVLLKDQIGIVHATLAQCFFAWMCALALFTSPWWQNRSAKPQRQAVTDGRVGPNSGLAPLFLVTTLMIFAQLILGATMRHQHAGLSIPDFPLAYGKLWPPMDAASVQHFNQQRIEVMAANPITAFQIGLQMVHRLLAGLILIAVGACAWISGKRLGKGTVVAKLAGLWLGLVLMQVLLGAATIWSNKAADIATLHVLTGALLLALGVLINLLIYERPVLQFEPNTALAGTDAAILNAFNPPHSAVARMK